MAEISQHQSFLDFFPVPKYLRLASVGLAITDESVKLLGFKRGFWGPELELSIYDETHLTPETVQSGFINDADKLEQVLKGLRAKYGLDYVYATLPEERAYLFTATIDKVPAESLRDAVAFILEENAPVRLANSVFDFEIVEELSATNQLKVTVAVISKKVVDFYIQVFNNAGIIPVSFDIESQAIARAIIARGDRRTQLILNALETKTGFYVIEDEVVQFTTTLQRSATSSSDDLKSELNKILAFWSTRTATSGTERKIERILVTGPGANEDQIMAVMNDCPVEHSIADVWTNARPDSHSLPQEISQHSLEYAAVIGLTLPHKRHV